MLKPKSGPRRRTPSPLAIAIGERIRAARQARKMTARALAEAVEIPAPHLSNLENGRVEPRASTLVALARALGCPPGELLPAIAPTTRKELRDRVDALPEQALPELDQLLSLLERAFYRN